MNELVSALENLVQKQDAHIKALDNLVEALKSEIETLTRLAALQDQIITNYKKRLGF